MERSGIYFYRLWGENVGPYRAYFFRSGYKWQRFVTAQVAAVGSRSPLKMTSQSARKHAVNIGGCLTLDMSSHERIEGCPEGAARRFYAHYMFQ